MMKEEILKELNWKEKIIFKVFRKIFFKIFKIGVTWGFNNK